MRGESNSLEEEYHETIDRLCEFISGSPMLKRPIVVYRSIDVKIAINVGDTLNNNGFIFTSLDRNTAEFYLQDTTKCYQKIGNNIKGAIKSIKGSTLFKINVPIGTNFMDISYYDHGMQYVVSEILFNKNIQLQIIDIIEYCDNIIVECILIFQ